MDYISTRGQSNKSRFTPLLLEGLAADGGLYVPEHYPAISETDLDGWRRLDYGSLAMAILQRFMTDIPAHDLNSLMQTTYNSRVFGDERITPLKSLGNNLHLLQLSNGPSLAFKDMALQLLGNLFEYVLEKHDRTLNILGATSGDTGSSAEYAMLGKQRIRVFMLSPLNKMSPFQTAQMYSLNDPRIFNIAIEGVFDQCQDLVKAVNSDSAFKHEFHLGAVNSINWARIAAQVVYYFKAWLTVTNDTRQKISFAVPSGNFGNIYAGYVAKRMGLPIHQLILAANENNVLDEFFKTGRYRVRPAQQVQKTSSPSMDIAKASNFERFIFDLLDRNAEKVRELWQQLHQQGEFQLDQSLMEKARQWGFVSGSSSHQDRLTTIRNIYQHSGVLIDPHTADGLHVAQHYHNQDIPLVCLETAQPAKFEETVKEAIGVHPERPEHYRDLENRPCHFDTLPVDAERLKDFIRRQVKK